MTFDLRRLFSYRVRRSIEDLFLFVRKSRPRNTIRKNTRHPKTANEEPEVVILGNPIISKSEWDTKKDIELTIRKQEFNFFRYQYNVERPAPTDAISSKNDFEISVLVSVYKPGDLLNNFLGELVTQTIFKDIEIVIVLVCPDLLEVEILSEFAAKYPNVLYRIYETRITIYEAWNSGLEMSSAPLITNMNVDDLRSADSLQTQVEYMKSHPWVDVGYQDIYYFLDRDLDWTSIVNVGSMSKLAAVTLTELAWFGINAPHNGPVWRRELHKNCGVFDPSLRSAGDYEFWMRIASAGKVFAKIPKSTVAYYFNPNGMSTSTDSPSTAEERLLQDVYRDKIKLESKVFSEIKVDSDFMNRPWEASEVFTIKVLDILKEIR
jgi:hypothetical protein